jgi:hypothetical protein
MGESASLCPMDAIFCGTQLSFYGAHPDDAEKYLHIVTGGDARLVHIPLQRAAAVILSKIELDRNNISQAAILDSSRRYWNDGR